MTTIPGFKFGSSLLLSVVLIATGCRLSQLKGVTESGSSQPTSAFSPSNNPRKDLGDALEKLNSAFPYRLTETTSASAPGQPDVQYGVRVVEFASADRHHAKWKSGPLGDTEVITIGDKEYTYINGKWIEGGAKSLSQREQAGRRFREKMASAIKDVQYLGAETVNGVSCYAYSYTMEMDVSGQKWSGTGKAWVGASDGLPHQLDSEMTVSSYHQKSHITYQYDVDFKIEKPAM